MISKENKTRTGNNKKPARFSSPRSRSHDQLKVKASVVHSDGLRRLSAHYAIDSHFRVCLIRIHHCHMRLFSRLWRGSRVFSRRESSVENEINGNGFSNPVLGRRRENRGKEEEKSINEFHSFESRQLAPAAP